MVWGPGTNFFEFSMKNPTQNNPQISISWNTFVLYYFVFFVFRGHSFLFANFLNFQGFEAWDQYDEIIHEKPYSNATLKTEFYENYSLLLETLIFVILRNIVLFIFFDFRWFQALGPIPCNCPWKIVSRTILKSQFHGFWKIEKYKQFLSSQMFGWANLETTVFRQSMEN